MKRTLALLFAVLLTLPAAFAYHGSYGYDGSYDYSSTKDFEYVNYHETEDARRSYNDCGYYSYDYYGPSCTRTRDNYVYHRSRDFEFGRYHEDVRTSSDYGRTYSYDSYRYPRNSYGTYYPSRYSFDYNGGLYSAGGGFYGGAYLPYGY